MPDFQQSEVTPTVSQETPVVENFTPISEPAPTTETVTPFMPEATQVPDLQQFVNNQVAEVPPMAAPMETPATTVSQDFNAAPADTTTPTQTGTPFSI
jgi:hypothetical protein